MVASGSFDNTGNTYNVTRIISDDATFNLDAYNAYSPLFISVTFAISYGLSFASVTATLAHTFIYYRKQIWTQARRSLSEQPDIHARLMSVYKGVPDWWYLSIFCASIELQGSECSDCTGTKVVRSVHVCVRCPCHRSLEHTVSCLGFRPRSHHLCVSRYFLQVLYLVDAPPLPIQHSFTRSQLVSFWPSRIRQSASTSSRSLSSATCSLVDRLR